RGVLPDHPDPRRDPTAAHRRESELRSMTIPQSTDPRAPAAPAADTSPARSASGRRAGVGTDRINWPATAIRIVCSLAVLVPRFVPGNMPLKAPAHAAVGPAFSLAVPFSCEGFEQAWELTNFPRGLASSPFITAVSVFGEIVISAPAAFAVVRNWDRRLFRWSFFYLLA